MDSKGDVKHFFGVRFAWHVPESCCCSSVSQLRLQGISANGSACSRGQKIVVLWIPKVTWSTFSACVLLGMCPNPAAVRVFRNCASKGFLLMVVLAREDKKIVVFARILLLFECFATAPPSGSACSRGQKILVLWIPKVTWSTFSACVLLGMCPNPAAVRVFRNCASKGFLLMVLLAREDKRLLFCCFMDSKGDVKHFFGVRFAWHVPESCCCSSVSQLRLQGISANGSACSRGQKIVFLLWIPKVTWSTFSACVLLGMCPNPAAVRVFRNCASKGFLLMVLLAREDKRLLFYGFQRWREALFRRAFCLACARILLLFECFATAPPRDFC